MSQLTVEAEPLLDLLLECDHEASLNDSFSTLGLPSIFGEDGLLKATKRHEQERASRQKQSSSGAALEKFFEEEVFACQDEMGLSSLLRKGSRLNEAKKTEQAPTKVALFRGNRWLESSGMSVSCRNFGYFASEKDTLISGKSRMPRSSREIVAQAISMSRAESAPDVMDASGKSMDVSGKSMSSRHLCESEADDSFHPMTNWSSATSTSRSDRWGSGAGLSQSCRTLGAQDQVNYSGSTSFSNLKNRILVTALPKETILSDAKAEKTRQLMTNKSSVKSTSRMDRWASGTGMSQSCRNLGSEEQVDDSATRAFSCLKKRSSIAILPKESSNDDRKSMLTMGKSLSSRNLNLHDSASSLRKGLTMKSKSVRHFSLRQSAEEEISPIVLPLSTVKRSNKISIGASSSGTSRKVKGDPLPTRSLTTKSKSVRHFSAREREEEVAESTLLASPLKRSNKMAIGASSGSVRNLNCELLPSNVPTAPTMTGLTRQRRSMTRSKTFDPSAPSRMQSSSRPRMDGRKSLLSMGRSLSARNLMEGKDEKDVPPTLVPMPTSPRSSNLSVCQEESSRCGLDESMPGSTRTGMDDSMPGLSPLTPSVRKTMNRLSLSSAAASLQVVAETCATEAISSPPFTDGEGTVDASLSRRSDMVVSPESKPAKEETPVFSTEEILKEIGPIFDARSCDDLSPTRAAGAQSRAASRRVQSSRRLSAAKEAANKSLPKSSLKAALFKSNKMAFPDRRQSSMSESIPTPLRVSSHDSQPTLVPQLNEGSVKPAIKSSMESNSRRVSAHVSKLNSISAHDSRASSLKAALHMSDSRLLDASFQGKKKSSSGKLSSLDASSNGKTVSSNSRLSSSNKQRLSGKGRKGEDAQRSSRNSSSPSGVAHSDRRANLDGESSKKLSFSAHSGSISRNATRLAAEKNLSMTVHLCDQKPSRELDSNTSGTSRGSPRVSSSRKHTKPKQRSSKVPVDEPWDSLRSSGKATRRLRPSSTFNESRSDSPNCVAEYAQGGKAAPSCGVKQVQGLSRRKRKSAPSLSSWLNGSHGSSISN